jgi:hypothetical protein
MQTSPSVSGHSEINRLKNPGRPALEVGNGGAPNISGTRRCCFGRLVCFYGRWWIWEDIVPLSECGFFLFFNVGSVEEAPSLAVEMRELDSMWRQVDTLHSPLIASCDSHEVTDCGGSGETHIAP